MSVPPQAQQHGGQYPPGDAVQLFAQCFHALGDNVERVVKGKRGVVELALVCLFSEGHLLIEDVPGTGKTTLARCIDRKSVV